MLIKNQKGLEESFNALHATAAGKGEMLGHSPRMETLEVPELLKVPDQTPHDEDPVGFADFLLTQLFQHSPALLHAEHQHPEESVTWFVRSSAVDQQAKDLPIAVSPSRGAFRSVLARFGHHYMSGQLYHGFATRLLRQRNIVYRCLIYTSNMGQSGFWIRVYGSPA